MKTELDAGNREDAFAIVDDIIQNLEKINHHGKRADAIVKGMLQHSRASSAQKNQRISTPLRMNTFGFATMA
jgi:hypothetical protein